MAATFYLLNKGNGINKIVKGTLKPLFTMGLCAFYVTSVSGCALMPNVLKKKDRNQSETTSNKAVGDRLSARKLDRGECGLFVWSADSARRFILFSQNQKKQAIWAGPNGEEKLALSSYEGQSYQQQYVQQSYLPVSATRRQSYREKRRDKTKSQAQINLILREIEELAESTRFKAGTLSYQTDTGYARVIPILGLSTCR